MKTQYLTAIVLAFIVTSCLTRPHTQHISLTNCAYAPGSKSTNFSHIGDYGFTIEIPGEWKFIGFDKSSRDNIFSDSLNQRLFIFNGSRGTSSFNKNNLEGDDFIRLFYNWDAEWYLSNNTRLKTRIIEKNTNNYLIAEYADSSSVSTSLYGTKSGNGVRITIVSECNRSPQTTLISAIYNNLR
ncbi:MAG: hypothetical protein V4590_00510 [Bacteroidota bacterium]